ncbi:hypothetical protein GYMLUDRAFT_77912 [Collybiopsis luxurians FD-317 M1]|uniref:Uncharacterized protein n=1 Tax=Collybiopsis luxurians FD-317 M1 TaxID=944289 RepID=A0A0D0BR90_9AGAR|nr:hypothetical protein GYMLUDRAFT_77912 [Collybiopsis luxurians FD-317 M1]
MESSECFPQEIFDLFIDQSSDSFPALKNLSLVAKSWLPQARKHLFRCLRIPRFYFYCKDQTDFEKQKEAMEKSFKHLFDTPEIKRCIKGFVIDTIRSSAGSRFGGPVGRRKVAMPLLNSPYSASPCDPVLRVDTGIDFLCFEWGAYFEPGGPPMNGSKLVEAFRKMLLLNAGVRRIYLKNAFIYLPSSGIGTWQSQLSEGLDLFECLAGFTSSLETLCLWNITFRFNLLSFIEMMGVVSTPELLERLRLTLRYRNSIYSAAAGETKVAMTRLLLGDSSEVSRNWYLEVILFENRFLVFTNLVYLALDSTQLPLFIGRPSYLCNVRHLTVFDKDADTHPDKWAYRKCRLPLPSLSSLQLIVTRYSSLITLCRVIFGLSRVELLEDGIKRPEYPGPGFYNGVSDSIGLTPAPARPRVQNLHIELDIDYSLNRSSITSALCARLDECLHSYLDFGDPELTGPVESVTVNWPDSLTHKHLPLTASTGKLRQGDGNFWWDVGQW